MKILLSYSKDHFDPSKSPDEHKYWGSSACTLARNIYNILSEIGSVTYIDNSDETVSGESFDLFVGIAGHFSDILKRNTIEKSILFAVNMHPYQRNKILKRFMRSEDIKESFLAGYELVKDHGVVKAIDQADFILCVGNNDVYNSYIINGVSRKKIKMINYAAFEGKNTNPLPRSAERHYVHVGSEIGIRKGFDIVCSMFSDPLFKDKDFHLDIIGAITSPFYQKKLNDLKELLGEKITYHGWIDSKDERYASIISRSDYLIHPALEEGQAGSVLEAMQLGVIPIITISTGVDFSPLGVFEKKIKSSLNVNLLEKSYTLSKKQIGELKSKTIEYYQELHVPFRENLRRSFEDIIANKAYPKVSIVLSIFNKEDSIVDLLKLLSSACEEYGNTELQIIFDGCNDKSEKLTRAFFKKNPKQLVYYCVTDNIWEVKSNNIGLRNATGRYTVIIQDDNFVYDKFFLFEAVQFFEKNPTVAILGGLAGVNFYPKNTSLPSGPGQTTMNQDEVYWRQDANTDPLLRNRIFQVDACMRGPLFIKKAFLEEYGYLDDAYAPLYNDDMDLCFRARSKGYKVYCILMNVENKNGTVAKYDSEKANFFQKMITRNAGIFYSRWQPSVEKDYLQILRAVPFNKEIHQSIIRKKLAETIHFFSRIFQSIKIFLKIFLENIKNEGVIMGIRKTISSVIRIFVNRYLPYVRYYLMKIAFATYSSVDDIERLKREKREQPWYQINGDETLRIDYDLNPSSIVLDIGGYKGDWASPISNMYGSTIHIFEPIKGFAEKIKHRFKNNTKVILHEVGLGARDEMVTIYVAEGGTSMIKSTEQMVKVEICDVHNFIKDLQADKIDLVKINIEGAEYELLNRIIDTGDIQKIENIQVQFHDFVPDAKNRMQNIQARLRETHHLTYQYEFVWENWEINEK